MTKTGDGMTKTRDGMTACDGLRQHRSRRPAVRKVPWHYDAYQPHYKRANYVAPFVLPARDRQQRLVYPFDIIRINGIVQTSRIALVIFHVSDYGGICEPAEGGTREIS